MSGRIYSPVSLKRSCRAFLLCFATTCLLHIGSYAASASGLVKIRAEAYAPGQGTRARDAAITAAKEEAVLLWIRLLIGETDKADLLPILQQVDRYAQSARVVNLEYDATGTTVTLEVYVREWPLRVDMAALLLSSLNRPLRVVLLIAEQGPSGQTRRFDSSGTAVKVLEDALNLAGLVVVEVDAVRERYSLREMVTYLQGGLESIAKFGRENRAAVVIAGNVTAQVRVQGGAGNVLRAHATIELSVVRAHDASLYDAIMTEAEVSCLVAEDGARMAIEDAAYKAREAVIVGAVLAAIRTDESAPGFELTLTNPRDWRDVELVAERLRSTSLTGEVEILRSRPGAGLIRFEYAGKMSALVQNLTVPLGGGRRLKTLRVVGNELLFEFSGP